MEIPKIVAVRATVPQTLRLTFSDGQVRDFDCAPYLDRGVFVRLKDPTLFGQAYVAPGTVCWPEDLDIAPETLFLRSALAEVRIPAPSAP